MVQSALEIVNSIPKSQSQFINDGSFGALCKVAFDEFTTSIRIYMGRDDQTFLQSINSSLNISNVMVGPCELVSGRLVEH